MNQDTLRRLSWLKDQGIDLAHPNAAWLVIGWGGQAYYTTVAKLSDVTAHATWRGVTGDASVMRVSLAGPLEPEWQARPIELTGPQYAALLDAIESSFAQGPQTNALSAPGFSGVDRFFPARDRFHIFRTCNVWIGKTLRAAGVKFGFWTPTLYSVNLSLHLFSP